MGTQLPARESLALSSCLLAPRTPSLHVRIVRINFAHLRIRTERTERIRSTSNPDSRQNSRSVCEFSQKSAPGNDFRPTRTP